MSHRIQPAPLRTIGSRSSKGEKIQSMASSSTTPTLREAQVSLLLSLLNFNYPVSHSSVQATASNNGITLGGGTGTSSQQLAGAAGGELPIWKVLVMDKTSQDILATSLRVQDLKDHGVTLHLQLHSDRPPLPDVPAVYFVAPKTENFKRIASDLSKGLYESAYVNFTSSLSSAQLQEFAGAIASDSGGNDASIEQVYDQYLDFVVLENSLFELLPARSAPVAAPLKPAQAALSDSIGGSESKHASLPTCTYEILNDPKSGEAEVEDETDRIASGLFSVLATFGQASLPIIRSPRGNAAELVARKLEGKLRDHMASSRGQSELFAGGGAGGGASSSAAWTGQRPRELRLATSFPTHSADIKILQCS